MINREETYKKIARTLASYASYVGMMARVNLNDANLFAEATFKGVLNSLYGLELVNANSYSQNAAGIDLIDKERKLFVQVSVSATRDKINHTLDKLKDRQAAYDGYHLLFLFLTEDANDLRTGKEYAGVPTFLTFVKKGEGAYVDGTDILDFTVLLRRLNDAKLETLEQVGKEVDSLGQFSYVANNEAYRQKFEKLKTLGDKIAKARKKLEDDPEDDIYKDYLQQNLNAYNKLKEELVEDSQALVRLAQNIIALKGQEISERLQQAIAAFDSGDFAEAKRLLDEAEKDFDANSVSADHSLSNVFRGYEELQLKTKAILADTSMVIDLRIFEASTLWKKIDDSVQKYNYAGHEPEKCMKLLYDYYVFLDQYGKYKEALTIQTRLLSLRQSHYGEEHEDTADSYNDLGYLHDHLGHYQEAITYLEKAISVKEKVLGTDHPDTATSYNNIGFAYYRMGEYPKALEYYEKDLAICEKVLGAEHPDTAMSYNNIGGVYDSMGEYPKALEYYGKALDIREKVLGAEHPSTALSYNNIGCVYNDMGEYPKALEYHEKALGICEKVLGAEHPHTATSYNNIGAVYKSMGEYPKALEYYGKDLAICEKVLGADHPDTATSYNNIGLVYSSKGEYPKALEYLEKALAIFERVLGAEHPYTKGTKEWIQDVQSRMKEKKGWFQRLLSKMKKE